MTSVQTALKNTEKPHCDLWQKRACWSIREVSMGKSAEAAAGLSVI